MRLGRAGMKHAATITVTSLLTLTIALSAGCIVAVVDAGGGLGERSAARSAWHPDVELAQLLVKLEVRTRGVIANHYGGADEDHKTWLAENLLLPAAVADKVFHDTVPSCTGGRAWVKMVVDEPRNPHNAGDATAIAMLARIKEGASKASRRTGEAYYYAEPIVAAKGCLRCHGSPRGEPDPFFPQYKKNGWEEGAVVGAVVARVAPAR